MDWQTTDQRSDEELVAAVNRGDAEAFEALYRRYRQWVLDVAWRLTGDRELAQDTLQETFLYFLGRFPGFELRARLKTFLYPAVRHIAVAAASRSRRLPHAGGPAVDLPGQASGGGPERDESLGHLHEALWRLPAGQREVLLLRFADDLALAEIAVALGVPVGTVKSRLHQGLAALRNDDVAKKYFNL